MKVKHNKKRNTAFLFEALVKELTKTVIEKNKKKTSLIKSILKEHFRSSSILGRELDCYEALSNKSGLDKYTAEKLVFRAKKSYEDLDQQKIFEEQSKVISKINKNLSKEVYNNFVPNYQSLASISQLFGNRMPVKTRVLMEQKIIERLVDQKEETKEDMKSIDSLVVRSFTDNFNEAYDNLFTEQKELLNKYVSSFDESRADFRLFVGSELKRIYESVSKSLTLKDVAEDADMVTNTKKVLERIQSMNVSKIGDKEILKILKLQNLTREYNSDAN
tara:strand:+ start:233 stop:1060 length:828 start_codon:yes stop_codon:yes gene_type:complete